MSQARNIHILLITYLLHEQLYNSKKQNKRYSNIQKNCRNQAKLSCESQGLSYDCRVGRIKQLVVLPNTSSWQNPLLERSEISSSIFVRSKNDATFFKIQKSYESNNYREYGEGYNASFHFKPIQKLHFKNDLIHISQSTHASGHRMAFLTEKLEIFQWKDGIAGS